MRLNADTRIIVGPPGTGKTRRLIELATDVIRSGCPSEHVGYISFTRQAVREASARIRQEIPLPAESFIGFKTLHAMIYWLRGHSHENILTDNELHEVAGMAGQTRINHAARACALRYAHMLNHHRVSGCGLEPAYHAHKNELTGSLEDFLQWVKTYQGYKKRTGRIDFVDMIMDFVARDVSFPFVHLFVDEAQDFTPDQWAAVSLLARCAGTVYVAGDSDQAIFEWAGGNGRIFDELEGHREILEQSHRVPYWPHFVAGRVLEDMGRQIVYRPTPELGGVYGLLDSEIGNLPLDNGETWFLLARDNFQVKNLEKILFERGIPFRELSISAEKADRVQGRYLRRIDWYNRMLAGETIRPYAKAQLETIVPGLDEMIAAGTPWQEAFSCWPIDRIRYFSQDTDWDQVKVHVGTFHSSKGAEADNVVLLDACTRRVDRLYREAVTEAERTAELKALYVAMTRTRNRLFLVCSQARNFIPFHRFASRLPEDLANGLIDLSNQNPWR